MVVENWGDSARAQRLGVLRYPAVFVDDAIFATPRDLGFYGTTQEGGRYTPWRDPANHERFRQDLIRLVERALAGEAIATKSAAVAEPAPLAELPSLTVSDLSGRELRMEDLRGKTVLVEFWATWCPPCLKTLGFLDALSREHPDVAVVALAVESEEKDVRSRTADLGAGVRFAMGTPEVVRPFGDLLAVPTLMIFRPDGRLATTLYGSPPDLHDQVRRWLASSESKPAGS